VPDYIEPGQRGNKKVDKMWWRVVNWNNYSTTNCSYGLNFGGSWSPKHVQCWHYFPS